MERNPSNHQALAILGMVSLTLVTVTATASEGGTSHYLPGAVATLIDLAPTQPGWVIEPIYLYYEGDASTDEEIPIAGLNALGLPEATKRVDAWYAADPDRMDLPVLSVLWIDTVKPKIRK